MKTFRVAGVTFENRLEKIQKYTSHGAKIYLVREPENKFDPNAIAVKQEFKNGGRMTLGYVPKKLNVDMAKWMDRGWSPQVQFGMKFINQATGDCKGLQLRYEPFNQFL